MATTSSGSSAAAVSESFLSAYDEVLAVKWPVGTTHSDVPTPWGTTRINSYGPEGAPPLVLLAGGGSTSTVWFAQAAHLGRTHRVHAVDLIGDPGRSAAGERPIRTVPDLTAWLDAVLDALNTASTALCGHSYGAWIALHYTLHAPDRVRRLILVDPTQCFAGFRPGYLLHALPMLLRPSAKRTRIFMNWETAGATLDPAWLHLRETAADFPTARPVNGPRPTPEALSALNVPTLILTAENSRAHNAARVATTATRLLPHARTATIPGATHHTLPLHAPDAAELNRRIEGFLLTE
ncbi:alpha/beta hydrolase [Streptomyces sp. NBC_00841]|uniref:alpha/beta fold hydrolase n=1 Tax=unclassified Streptomyces TaxID=2593676 RepID=UPI00224F430E|nr:MULTISPECIES: alpha/beta hydrolase [unclassified Streptomyces]MCX4535525.1 alpha/beta hydrolase [Streptomyces sp. NBC_01669]WRZ99186.1 alpha/beta hydrolase [Streptomyces sp. NBC_00841]